MSAFAAGLALLGLLAPIQERQDVLSETSVGMVAELRELVLPGPELEALPAERGAPLIVRVTRSSPHGDAFRYDLEWSALEPGEYDLRDGLRRVDRGPLDRSEGGVPPIPVRVRSLLPPGQVEPLAQGPGDVPRFGGYRILLTIGAVVWVLGLLAILFVGRERKQRADGAGARPRTLAERLTPLVERARTGELSGRERAQLEGGLVAYWRRRLGLEQQDPRAALSALYEHDEAGPLLRRLEVWLHAPGTEAEVDVAELLAPYRDLPADALELEQI